MYLDHEGKRTGDMWFVQFSLGASRIFGSNIWLKRFFFWIFFGLWSSFYIFLFLLPPLARSKDVTMEAEAETFQKSSQKVGTRTVTRFSPARFSSITFIPKLLLRLILFFRRTAALSRKIRTFPQLSRFCSDLGNSGIRQIVRNSMLTGR